MGNNALRSESFEGAFLSGRGCQHGMGLLIVPIGRLFSYLSLILMSAPVSHLTELPIEITEQILLHLPGQDIIKMEAVRRAFIQPRVVFDFVLVWPRSVDTSGILFTIRPPFTIGAKSSLLA